MAWPTQNAARKLGATSSTQVCEFTTDTLHQVDSDKICASARARETY